MVLLSLVFSVTCLIIIIGCVARISYLYGQIKSDDEWKVKYEKLYTTATAEILKAKGYYSSTMYDLGKTPEVKNNSKKIKPLEKINKDKTDSIPKNSGLRVVRPDDESKKED